MSIIAPTPAAARARPAASLGSGASWRTVTAERTRSDNPWQSSGCSSSISPAAAPPRAPVTQTASPSAAPRPADHRLGGGRPADRGHADREDTRARDVAAEDRDLLALGELGEAVAEGEAVLAPEVLGHPEPDVGLGRRRAHRREIAERRADRLAPDRLRRAPAPAEGHAVDERVDCDRIRLAVAPDGDRGVVADPDPHRVAATAGRRRQPVADRADQIELRGAAQSRFVHRARSGWR